MDVDTLFPKSSLEPIELGAPTNGTRVMFTICAGGSKRGSLFDEDGSVWAWGSRMVVVPAKDDHLTIPLDHCEEPHCFVVSQRTFVFFENGVELDGIDLRLDLCIDDHSGPIREDCPFRFDLRRAGLAS